MGAWGPAIFSNDDACDIRDSYKEMIIMGIADETAEQRIIEANAEMIAYDPSSFWLPLAITQWTIGRLSEPVKKNAFKAIEQELANLHTLWDPKYIGKRRNNLLKAQEQLCSPMPPRKKLRMPWWAYRCPWEAGNVLQYKHIETDVNHQKWNGTYVLLQIIGICRTPPDKIPIDCIAVSLYPWQSATAPSETAIRALKNNISLIPFPITPENSAPYCALLPSPQIVKEHDIKPVSSTPLADNYEFVPNFISTPAHSILDIGIPKMLDDFQNACQREYVIPPSWRVPSSSLR